MAVGDYMSLKDAAQRGFDGAMLRVEKRFPVGFWKGASALLADGVFEYMPPPGMLAGELLRLRVDRTIFPYVMAKQAWQPGDVRLLISLLEGDDFTLVDIGANMGLFTRQLLACTDKISRAVCFEPDPASFDLMTFNLAAERDHVTLVNAAVAEKSGSASLFMDPSNAGHYSLLPGAGASRSVATISADQAADAILKSATGPIVYKSDTEGYDEEIATLLPGSVWDRVTVALLEISQVSKPPLRAAAFRAILDRFPRRFFASAPDRALSVDDVLAFARRTSGSFEDLVLARA